ncbi:MAG: response regulator [Kiritimatiellae bacterium]|nr:response regulator [Kiritimatiellia bacterium]
MNVNKKILLVDDDPDIIEQMSAVLDADGYDVFTAAGEVAGEDLLGSIKPDLVIMNLMMEEKDSGFTLAHHLQNIYPGTPAILLTAVTSVTGLSFDLTSPDARAWMKVDKILAKPVRPEQLKAVVCRLLEDVVSE